jgi:hypothetical protein
LKPGENGVLFVVPLLYHVFKSLVHETILCLLTVCLRDWNSTEIEGLKRKLCSKLAVNSPSFPPNWQVMEPENFVFSVNGEWSYHISYYYFVNGECFISLLSDLVR